MENEDLKTNKEATEEIEKDLQKDVGYETDPAVIKQMFCDYRSGDPEKKEMASVKIVGLLEKLVRSVARKRFATYCLQHEDDLIMEGWAGCWAHLDEYDPEKGAISTFFYDRIFGGMYRYVSSFVHKTSPEAFSRRRTVRGAIDRLTAQGVSCPSAAEIAAEAGTEVDTVEDALAAQRFDVHAEFDPATVKIAADDIYSDPSKMLLRKDDTTLLYAAMDQMLTSEEWEVLTRTFGIGYDSPQSKKSISKATGIAEERISAIYEMAKNKIACSPRMEGFSYTLERQINPRDEILFEPVPWIDDSDRKSTPEQRKAILEEYGMTESGDFIFE